jgi:hypothetical protein
MKDGSLRVVQDFREFNANSLDDRYSMKDINECIGTLVDQDLQFSPPWISLQDFGKCL